MQSITNHTHNWRAHQQPDGYILFKQDTCDGCSTSHKPPRRLDTRPCSQHGTRYDCIYCHWERDLGVQLIYDYVDTHYGDADRDEIEKWLNRRETL